MKNSVLRVPFSVLLLIISNSLETIAQTCRPSGALDAENSHQDSASKRTTKFVAFRASFYTTYTCSPPVSVNAKATLTLNSFQKGGGGAPSECDNQYHSDNSLVVALSTGWYKSGERCHKFIMINANGLCVKAMVVDECDSSIGSDKDHDYQPPCRNNMVDASKAVWEALGVPKNNWGAIDITWSYASLSSYFFNVISVVHPHPLLLILIN